MSEAGPIAKSAKVAVLLLIAAAAVNGIAVASDFLALGEDEALLAAQGAIGTIQIVVFVATAVAFLVWWGHASARSRQLDPVAMEGLSPQWAVASWFVPFLNLVYPYQIAKRMFWANAEQSEPRPVTPTFISRWWGTFIISGLMSRAAGRADSLEFQTLLFLGSDLLGLIAAVQGVRVVSALSGPVAVRSVEAT